MKIDRQALIFGAIILAVIVVVAGIAWISSLFTAPDTGEKSPVESFFSSLFPFGDTVRPTPGVGGTDGGEDSGPVPTLRQVTAAPVSGFELREGSVLRYAERETGHIFETPFASFSTTRISNTTIPRVHTSIWLPGNSVVFQYAGTNEETRNFFATIASSTPDQALLGRFLDAATEIYPGTKEGDIIRVRRGESGTLADRVTVSTGQAQTLFSSTLRSWRVLPAGPSLFVATAPSSIDGFLYRVAQDQSLEKVLGGLKNLSVLPHPNGRYIAYSSGSGNLAVLDLKESRAYGAQVVTFADKCTWFPGDAPLLFCGVSETTRTTSIEAWFMGIAPLSDTAWIVDPIQGSATIVSHLNLDAGRAIDVWRPAVSPDGSYAAFMDKNDLSLWLLELPK